LVRPILQTRARANGTPRWASTWTEPAVQEPCVARIRRGHAQTAPETAQAGEQIVAAISLNDADG
jgi:hypothetical protein